MSKDTKRLAAGIISRAQSKNKQTKPAATNTNATKTMAVITMTELSRSTNETTPAGPKTPPP